MKFIDSTKIVLETVFKQKKILKKKFEAWTWKFLNKFGETQEIFNKFVAILRLTSKDKPNQSYRFWQLISVLDLF